VPTPVDHVVDVPRNPPLVARRGKPSCPGGNGLPGPPTLTPGPGLRPRPVVGVSNTATRSEDTRPECGRNSGLRAIRVSFIIDTPSSFGSASYAVGMRHVLADIGMEEGTPAPHVRGRHMFKRSSPDPPPRLSAQTFEALRSRSSRTQRILTEVSKGDSRAIRPRSDIV